MEKCSEISRNRFSSNRRPRKAIKFIFYGVGDLRKVQKSFFKVSEQSEGLNNYF